MPPLDFSHAQPIDHSVGHLAPAAPDCSFAHEIQTQVSASMAQPMPGAESLMAAPGMPPLPGAEQAVSPLIQMIMRMPGHIGLASSFFEALSHFFLPQTDMLNLFDPSQFGLHFDLSSATPGDHGSIDFSLLPHDAPILDHLGSVDLGGAHSLDLASDKLNISLGGDAHFVADNGGANLSLGSQYNVSGAASLAKPQFEGAGGLVSGPGVSGNFSADSLASNNRLFSDGQTISSANNNMMVAGGNSSSGMLATPSLTQGASAASLSNSVNMGTSTVAGNSAAGTGMVENVSAQGSPANNVSYNVFEKLAGNKEILAANNVSDSYHSTIGTIQPDAPMDNVSHSAAPQAASHSATTAGDNFGGLKAKPMALDGSHVELKADHAKLDQIGDHKAAHPVEHKVEHAAEHKVEQTAEHKVEHASVQKPEHAAAHQAEHATPAHTAHTTQTPAEHIAHEAAKPVEKITDEAAKAAAQPIAHNATNSPAHGAAPVHHSAHSADHVKLAEAHPPSAQHTVEAKHIANPASQAGAREFDAGKLVQPESMQPHVQPHGTPTEAVQSASAVDAQNQFGDPVNGANNGVNNAGDAAAGHTGDAAAGTNASDATQTQDGSGQTLEQQQTPVAKTYTIRSGDCLWNIAKDQLGDATKWSDLYKVNVDVLGSNPSLIHPGVSIQMPGAEGAVSGNIAHYTVKAGDNLWNIAKAQFGDATKWGDLYKANQDIIGANPDLIRPGQELTFTTGGADPTANSLSSSATGTTSSAGNLAQAPAPAGHATAAPATHAGGDAQVSQNSAPIDTYGAPPTPELNASSMQSASSSDINFEPAPIQHNIQAPQAPAVTPLKVMPVEAQPDVIIQPAHAADLSGVNTVSHEAANAAHSLTQGQKHGMVDSSAGSDLLSVLNKRR